MRKKHWIRKHLDSSFYLYDFYSACGRFAVLTGTIFRKKVTCKTCLKIMRRTK